MGGPNNIDNFFNSFQRAAGFHDITPVRRGSISTNEPDDPAQHDTRRRPQRPPLQSILTQQMLGAEPQSSETIRPVQDQTEPEEATETTNLLNPPSGYVPSSYRPRLASDIISQHGEYGMSYGSISSRISRTARKRATILINEQIEASRRARDMPEEYKDDLLERPVEVEELPDGEVIERIIGESTVPMTIFNSTNVLIGVGILALPLAIRYSGWVIGLSFLTIAAVMTAYTAMILSKCLDTNVASTTYGDIAFVAFGQVGRSFVEVLFILELVAANTALIILFADSMYFLVPSVQILYWKFIIALGLIPLNFVSFKALSVTSVLGIVCVGGLIVSVLVNGLIKPHSPGSLREVATTYAFPENWKTIPLSFGLIMAPWGGHSIFPAIYKDMRHPRKYGRAVRSTYIFTYGLDLTMAVLGYLMFGEQVRDEITANILNSNSYPHIIRLLMVVLIAIIPVTKIPLSNRPIMDTVNKKFMIDLRQMDARARIYSERALSHRLGRGSTAVLVNILELAVAIGLPSFDAIMGIMGSALCFTICATLPLLFYVKIFWGGGAIKFPEKALCFVLITACIILSVVGTGFSVLPKEKLGIKSCDGRILCY